MPRKRSPNCLPNARIPVSSFLPPKTDAVILFNVSCKPLNNNPVELKLLISSRNCIILLVKSSIGTLINRSNSCLNGLFSGRALTDASIAGRNNSNCCLNRSDSSIKDPISRNLPDLVKSNKPRCLLN